jgi:hypothetical protein
MKLRPKISSSVEGSIVWMECTELGIASDPLLCLPLLKFLTVYKAVLTESIGYSNEWSIVMFENAFAKMSNSVQGSIDWMECIGYSKWSIVIFENAFTKIANSVQCSIDWIY